MHKHMDDFRRAYELTGLDFDTRRWTQPASASEPRSERRMLVVHKNFNKVGTYSRFSLVLRSKSLE